jgi:MotA/TolQ/ExbB proton channel family
MIALTTTTRRGPKDGTRAEKSRVRTPARRRPLFLRWVLVNALTLVAFVAAFVSYDGQVHAVGRVTGGIVLAVFALAAGYCGLLAWRSGEGGGRAGTRGLEHVALAIRVCPMVAMLGTASGFLIAFSGSADDVQQRVAGASTGIVATVVGVACTIVLMVQRHLLDEQ